VQGIASTSDIGALNIRQAEGWCQLALPTKKSVQGFKPVLNEVKDLSSCYGSFEAQDARGAHFER
jgi:hypothetical protein